MRNELSRRQFVRATAAIGAGLWAGSATRSSFFRRFRSCAAGRRLVLRRALRPFVDSQPSTDVVPYQHLRFSHVAARRRRAAGIEEGEELNGDVTLYAQRTFAPSI